MEGSNATTEQVPPPLPYWSNDLKTLKHLKVNYTVISCGLQQISGFSGFAEGSFKDLVIEDLKTLNNFKTFVDWSVHHKLRMTGVYPVNAGHAGCAGYIASLTRNQADVCGWEKVLLDHDWEVFSPGKGLHNSNSGNTIRFYVKWKKEAIQH